MDCIDPGEDLVAKLGFGACKIALQLFDGRRADDVAGHEGLRADEGESHLRWIQTMLAGQPDVARAGGLGLRVGVASEATEQADTCVRRASASLVFAGEHAERHGRIGQQATSLAQGDFGEADFKAAIE